MIPYSDNFLNDLDLIFVEINKKSKNPIVAAIQIVEIIEEKIKELHRWLKKYTFPSEEEEIHFFKCVKPKLISKLIYYNRIIEIQSGIPAPKKNKVKFLEKELEQISQYSKKNKSFYQYYRSGSKYHDHKYFTRSKDKKVGFYQCHIINYDFRLCTPHDYTVAEIMANDLLVIYLEEKLERLKSNQPLEKLPSLSWTGNKIDLVELIYALQKQKVINDGNIDIKDFAISIGQIFNIELEESVYRSYLDIKSRKNNRTKFITALSETLNTKILEED